MSNWNVHEQLVTVFQCPFLVLVVLLASLRRTFKPGRRKHKHKALLLASYRFTRRFLVLMLVFMLVFAWYV